MLWLYDFLTPAVLLRHITLFLLVAAMAMPTLLLLRVVAIASGVVAIVLSGFVAYDPVSLFWAVLFVVVIVVRMVLHARRHRGRPLAPEERLFHEKVVPSLSPAQTRQLIDVGQWRDVAAGTALTRQGEVVRELCFVSRGRADILVDERKVAECGPGSLIGEIGLVDRRRGDGNRGLHGAGPLSRLRGGQPLRVARPPSATSATRSSSPSSGAFETSSIG